MVENVWKVREGRNSVIEDKAGQDGREEGAGTCIKGKRVWVGAG